MGKSQKDEQKEAQVTDEEATEIAQYDVLPKMAPFMDRHMLNTMLMEARESNIYKFEDVTRSLIQIAYEAFLPHAEVLTWVEGLYQSIGEDVEDKWKDHSEAKMKENSELEEQVMPLLHIFEDDSQVAKIKDFKYRSDMCYEFEIDQEAIDALVPYTKRAFEAGEYDKALKLLCYYFNLPQADPSYFIITYAGNGEIIGQTESNQDDAEEAFRRKVSGLQFGRTKEKDGDKDPKSVVLVDAASDKAGAELIFTELDFSGASRDRIPDMQAWWEAEMARTRAAAAAKERNLIWGALAASILVSPDEASGDVAKYITRMDEHLNQSEAPKHEILLHRTWLVHWALFAIFKKDKIEATVLDFFLSEKSLSVISLSCPHIFRYVGACLILQKKKKHVVKETVWIIHHEASSYSDPITRFLLALYTEMDYDEAQKELQKCELLCKGDYFLKQHWHELQENARLHIFESYCRIHQCINIHMLAEKLNMQAEEAELWIVKLIQNAKLDARIDSEKGRVVMTKAPPNVYQQVIEKTKNLAFRSTMLFSNLEKTN